MNREVCQLIYNETEWIEFAYHSGTGSNYKDLEMMVFLAVGKTGVSGEKPFGARVRTNNKLNSRISSPLKFDTGP